MRSDLLLLPLILCTVARLGVAHPVQEQPAALENRARAAQLRQVQEDSLRRLIRPSPIDRAILEAVPEKLGFDKEARVDWAAKCEQYRAGWRELAAEASVRSAELWLAAYDWNRLHLTFEARPVSELTQLHESSMKVRRALRRMESDLLGDLPLIATSDHIPMARSIVFHQLLERSWRPLDLEGADVDMTRLVADLELEDDLLESLESNMEDYRNTFSESSAIYAQLFDENALTTAYEIVQLGPRPEHVSSPELLEEIDRDRDARALGLLEQATRMLAINQKYLHRVRDFLPSEKGLELIRSWRMLLGGAHLSEHAMLQELATDIAATPDLDADQSAAILMVPGEVAERNSILDVRITDQNAAVESIELESPTADRDIRLLAMQARLLQMHIKRRTTLLLALRTINGILGSDVPAATERLRALQKLLGSRTKSDQELSKRSERRSRDIEARLAWEEEERLVLESLEQQRQALEQESEFEENPP